MTSVAPVVVAEDLDRAARLLVVRSRREARGLFAGNYASAFRGGGLDFEESRPYVAGDDVTSIDWNATARCGELFVKRFREERNQTLLLGLDTSGSMGFGSVAPGKARVAAHALALLVAAAARAGDRTGFVGFDAEPRAVVPPGRGGAHALHVIRSAVRAAASTGGPTRLAAALKTLRSQASRRSVLFLFSDFRDPHLDESAELRELLAELCSRHDVVAVPVVDPAELDVPRVGTLRIADPERPGAVRLLRTGSARARKRYRRAALAWRQRLTQQLRRPGCEVLWLPTERSPLHLLGRFFRERAERRSAR